VFKKLENKIKELALKIHKSRSNDSKSIYENSKKLYELTIIYKYLTNQEKDNDWLVYEGRLKETLKGFNLETKKTNTPPSNAIEIIPLIDSIKDLVTEIPESDDDK
tara:strand:- start:303 stop:620 length:318 start_codon:yes stop_codon:yes gene_type:complete